MVSRGVPGLVETTKTLEELYEEGRLAAAQLDGGKWAIGDIALTVEKAYGPDLLGDFAKNVNISKRSAQQYRQVAAFYEKRTRVRFLEEWPSITWSHCRRAMRLGDYEASMDLLERAASELWTVDQMDRKMAEDAGRPLVLFQCEATIDGLCAGSITLLIPRGLDLSKLGAGQRVQVTLKSLV
jgi:hypothetical protein